MLIDFHFKHIYYKQLTINSIIFHAKNFNHFSLRKAKRPPQPGTSIYDLLRLKLELSYSDITFSIYPLTIIHGVNFIGS